MVDVVLPLIYGERCTGCGTCVELCPTHAVELLDGRPRIVRPDDCDYCGSCEDLCPQGAIALPYEIVLADSSERAGGAGGIHTMQHVARNTTRRR